MMRMAQIKHNLHPKILLVYDQYEFASRVPGMPSCMFNKKLCEAVAEKMEAMGVEVTLLDIDTLKISDDGKTLLHGKEPVALDAFSGVWFRATDRVDWGNPLQKKQNKERNHAIADFIEARIPSYTPFAKQTEADSKLHCARLCEEHALPHPETLAITREMLDDPALPEQIEAVIYGRVPPITQGGMLKKDRGRGGVNMISGPGKAVARSVGPYVNGSVENIIKRAREWLKKGKTYGDEAVLVQPNYWKADSIRYEVMVRPDGFEIVYQNADDLPPELEDQAYELMRKVVDLYGPGYWGIDLISTTGEKRVEIIEVNPFSAMAVSTERNHYTRYKDHMTYRGFTQNAGLIGGIPVAPLDVPLPKIKSDIADRFYECIAENVVASLCPEKIVLETKESETAPKDRRIRLRADVKTGPELTIPADATIIHEHPARVFGGRS